MADGRGVQAAASVAMLLACGLAQAQDYTTRQPTVAGGGGSSSAPPYELNATAGEPAVSRLAAGAFVLYSGFQASIDAAPRALVLFRNGFEPPPPPLPPAAPPLPP